MATNTRSNRFLNSRRGRVLIENVTAYLFLLPAATLIFVFGIFPVGFAFFVSLHRWRRFPDDYQALGNYEKALGNFAYFIFIWLAIGALCYAVIMARRLWRASHADGDRTAWFFGLPGALTAITLILFINWSFSVLVLILEIPRRLIGKDVNLNVFMSELLASFKDPEVVQMSNTWLVIGLAALILSVIFLRGLRTSRNGNYLFRTVMIALLVIAGVLLLQLTVNAVQTAISTAREKGEELPVWSQTILISLGAALMVAAYVVWRLASQQYQNRKFAFMIGAALLLMFGGYLLIVQLPQMLSLADDDMLNGFSVTIMYSMGTVPFQLGIGMVLAYLLFQNIKGKTFFRMVFFLPYITPWVASSVVFKVLFSHRETSLINQGLGKIGIAPQKWLLEPTGIFQLLFGQNVPDWLAGPGLALVVIMMFSIWTYIGYDAVVFLAGLGNISPDLYEAARIDGASRWREFRHITFPLLSPTTFFLSLIAIIGTFKAFTNIWIMRSPAAGGSVDTVSIYIFETIRTTNPNLGYGSAMAFVLFGVILVLTLVQNRIAGRKVFYG
jgi:multiple sugar transport system permease protein